MFGPVVMDRASIPNQIAERLRELLRTGGLSAGDRLPPERELAVQLNVSRASLREAVRLLEASGLVVVRRGRGTFVASMDVNGHLQDLLEHAVSPSVVPSEVRDLYQIRRVLEVEAVGWAESRIGDEAIKHLFGILARAAELLQVSPLPFDELQQLDGEFHGTIFRASGNQVLVRIVNSLLDLLAESRRYSIRRPGRAQRVWKEHQSITEALAAHDARLARQCMRKHIDSATLPKPPKGGRREA